MNPLRLRATNYRSFPELDLDLPQGCVAVIGENGAGKSSVINLIDIALFGPEGRSLADYLTDDGIADVCVVELTFEHQGTLYRARRGFSARGRGKTSVDFEVLRSDHDPDEHDQWEPLTGESTKETDHLIEQTIGLSRATFRASAFLAQSDGAAFTDAAPAKRKEILAEILGLDIWAQLQERAKADRRGAEAQLQRLAGENEAALEIVRLKPEVAAGIDNGRLRLAELDAAIAAAEANLADLEQRYRIAADQAGQRAALEAQLTAARADLDRLHHDDVAATEAVMHIGICRDELETLTTETQHDDLVARERELLEQIGAHDRALAEHRAAKSAYDTEFFKRAELLGRASDLNEKAASYRMEASMLDARPLDDGARCDHCGQILGVEAREERLAKYEEDAAALDAEAKQLDDQAAAVALPSVPEEPKGEPPVGELADVRSQLKRVQVQAQQRARLEERIAQLDRTVAQRPSQNTIATAAKCCLKLGEQIDDIEPVDLAAITAAGSQARANLNRSREQHQQHTATVARLEERLTQILQAEQRLAANADRTCDLQAEVDLCVLLEKAYGRDGVPALVIENSAIPYIETEAARILAALGGSTAACTIELRTQAALKTGDGLRDTLDVIIVGDQGARAYETFSGGERTRINLALRIALARLLAHRRGAESRLLAIDEPEFLDEAGTAALVDVLRGLQSDFDRVYLISHVPALRDSFDEVISVVKDDSGRSIIEAALVTAEAVA